MSVTAYFIGGPWDLTKKILEKEEDIIIAYEPNYPLEQILNNHNEAVKVLCNAHEYRGCFRVMNSSVIYEWVGIQRLSKRK